YLILRTIEHSLQLMHNQQEHVLPTSPRSLAYLARRLDFPDGEAFVRQYERHTQAVREIFERYIVDDSHPLWNAPPRRPADEIHFGQAAGSYREFFSAGDIQRHLQLLEELSEERQLRVYGERI